MIARLAMMSNGTPAREVVGVTPEERVVAVWVYVTRRRGLGNAAWGNAEAVITNSTLTRNATTSLILKANAAVEERRGGEAVEVIVEDKRRVLPEVLRTGFVVFRRTARGLSSLDLLLSWAGDQELIAERE